MGMHRNTKLFNGNYHAVPGTADSLREALSMCFIIEDKRQKMYKSSTVNAANRPWHVWGTVAADPTNDLCEPPHSTQGGGLRCYL